MCVIFHQECLTFLISFGNALYNLGSAFKCSRHHTILHVCESKSHSTFVTTYRKLMCFLREINSCVIRNHSSE